MIEQGPIIIVLLLLLGTAAGTLLLDARQRRIDRQVANALSTAQLESTPSIRRTPVTSRWQFLHQITNYKPGIAYSIRPPFVLLAGSFAAAAVFYANAFLGFSPLRVTLAAVVAAVLVVRGLFGWQRRTFADRLFRQLPDAIAMVTGAVRSGLPVNEAFRTISREMPQPTAGQFALICSELALGRPPEEALEGVYLRTGVAEYGFFAVTLGVQMKSGGGLAETLQTLADTVRQRVVLAGRARAMAGEVIFSARALTLSPFITAALFYKINPIMIDLLFTHPTGRKMLAFAGASVLVGTMIIRWMIRKDTAL